MTTNTKGPTMITATEPKCITERRKQLEKQIDDLETLIQPATDAEQVFAESGEIEFCSISGVVRVALTLDDYRDVVPYLQELAKRGYHAAKGSEFYEDDERTCRCYTRGLIKVWTYLTGRKCKRVQVGKRTVPVYEIQCGDEA